MSDGANKFEPLLLPLARPADVPMPTYQPPAEFGTNGETNLGAFVGRSAARASLMANSASAPARKAMTALPLVTPLLRPAARMPIPAAPAIFGSTVTPGNCTPSSVTPAMARHATPEP